MVLSPEQVLERPLTAGAGVSLTIPIDIQIGSIRESIPSLDSLGLLFNPQINQDFFQRARAASQGVGIEIVPLQITSQKDVPEVLESSWGSIDGVWLIPDRTVISKSLVEFIIKEALYHRVPVIGYNRFFYQAGAALAFVFDYGDIGRQTGNIVISKLQGQDVRVQTAVFEVWKKEAVLERIGLKPSQSER
jgi:putative ABC transport system substrate-binding protein